MKFAIALVFSVMDPAKRTVLSARPMNFYLKANALSVERVKEIIISMTIYAKKFVGKDRNYLRISNAMTVILSMEMDVTKVVKSKDTLHVKKVGS